MRGEYVCPKSQKRRSMELPPHARRIRLSEIPETAVNGTTSACAENTFSSLLRTLSTRNYLRMRGEYVCPKSQKRRSMELPPHARRIRFGEHVILAFLGTTSACAENTTGSTCTNTFGGNYLRMRGEYPPCFIIIFAFMELPPHARRIRVFVLGGGCSLGTTSACAENTYRSVGGQCDSGNYLRMRGEYNTKKPKPRARKELPPHARRIRYDRNVKTIPIGTTSACAENTIAPRGGNRLRWNYLRMRGEYGEKPQVGAGILELPPHARRIHLCCLQCFFQLGTTSACAENTFPRRGDVIVHRNYLRMRGEYLTLVNTKEGCGELPPHARRIPWGASHGFHRGGTTSACAENTLEGR